MNPQYLFNFKDVGRVIQGMLLLASKSKVVPVKVAKKCNLTCSICIFWAFFFIYNKLNRPAIRSKFKSS